MHPARGETGLSAQLWYTGATMPRDSTTIWVLGDQLNRSHGALAEAVPGRDRVLLVESEALLRSRRWHAQRLHLVLTAMRRFARKCAAAGFEVDLRRAPTLAEGVAAHRRDHRVGRIRVAHPTSYAALRLARTLDCEVTPNDLFLTTPEEFAAWARSRRRLRMEDFYREMRRRTGLLMDGSEPIGGRWNFDDQNRAGPPSGQVAWPQPTRSRLDELDRAVVDEIAGYDTWGDPPIGWWPTSRRAALARLRHFVAEVLPGYGPHQDAMVTGAWAMRHSLLSPALNLGLLHPREVCDAVARAYASGRIPIASAEGFIRQVIGWREYVWGVYWLWMPNYRALNELGATRALPPVLTGDAPTEMRCVATAITGLRTRGWLHHIQRLMVLGNLCLLAGVDPKAVAGWMQASFVDGADWVMLPNVLGMALFADGGRMATKPYAASGAYIDRMSDSCGDCRFERSERTGDDACPFTTLYWDFLARHRQRLRSIPRMAQVVANVDRIGDLPRVRARAAAVLDRLDRGEL